MLKDQSLKNLEKPWWISIKVVLVLTLLKKIILNEEILENHKIFYKVLPIHKKVKVKFWCKCNWTKTVKMGVESTVLSVGLEMQIHLIISTTNNLVPSITLQWAKMDLEQL